MSKLLCTGDWHIRATNPQYRIDNYYKTLIGKIDWIINLALSEGCIAILQPGDFFDSPDQANHVEIDLIDRFQKIIDRLSIVSIFGQHDCKYRNRSNTALEKFRKAGWVHIANVENIAISALDDIYGASWEDEIPAIKNKQLFNILLIHKTITEKGQQWPGQTNYISAVDMLQQNPEYQLIISGDNHKSFYYANNTGRTLLNCGSLMRTTIGQRDHKPVVYIVDTDINEINQYFVPIQPIGEVMDLELADDVKERNEALEAFMKGLSSDYEVELNFEENLKQLIDKNKTDKEIVNLAKSFIAKYYNN